MNDAEAFLSEFHAARPGITARVFGRGGTYERVADRLRELAPEGTVLDLACGDGRLTRSLALSAGLRAVGADMSFLELAAARPIVLRTCSKADHVEFRKELPRVQARAQALPFADRSFDGATCHLAFMLFDEIEAVVAELARVLRPGAPFIALVGGGPSSGTEGRDAYHAYVELLARARANAAGPSHPPIGDRRASSEAGWRQLFHGWSGAGAIAFERWPIDLSGTFDDVWQLLSATYGHPADDAHIRDTIRAEFPGERVPCTVVTFLATVRR